MKLFVRALFSIDAVEWRVKGLSKLIFEILKLIHVSESGTEFLSRK